MSLYKTTLKGTESYCHLQGYSLFDDIVLPVPLSTQTAKELLIRRILYSSADYEVLYSDPVYLKSCIEDFFAMNKDNWQKVVDAMLEEYDPLWNYDRYEEHWGDKTDTRDLTGTKSETGTRQMDEDNDVSVTGTGSGQATRSTVGTNDVSKVGTIDSTDTDNTTTSQEDTGNDSTDKTGHPTATTEGKVAGFNSTDYVKHNLTSAESVTDEHVDSEHQNDIVTTVDGEKVNDTDTTETVDQDTTETETSTTATTTTETTAGTRGVTESNAVTGRSTEAEESTGRDHYKNIMHGNIGVTTSQQMLEAEYLVRLKYNIYDIITKMFMREFLILVDF